MTDIQNGIPERIRSHLDKDLVWITIFIASIFLTALISHSFIMVSAWVFLERKDDFFRAWKNIFKNTPAFIIFAPLFVYPLYIASGGSYLPGDDLLRHVTAWQHNYNYKFIYNQLDPHFPSTSMWIGFEWATGMLEKNYGFSHSVLLVVLTAYGLMSTTIYFLAKTATRGCTNENQRFLILIGIIMLLCSGLLFRTSLGRPEALLNIWALSAIFLPIHAWTLIGILLMPSYWLALIYIPAVILSPATWRMKIVSGTIITLFFLAFWLLYAGTDWTSFFSLLDRWTATRLISPGESDSIFKYLMNPVILGSLIAILLLQKRDDLHGLAVIAIIFWFLLPGQARYIGIIGPLTVYLAVRHLSSLAISPLQGIGLLMILLTAFGGTVTTVTATGKERPYFKLPAQSVVISEFDISTYLLPAMNPGIRISPAMEFGAINMSTQELIKGMYDGIPPDCEKLRRQGFTHVVEKSLQRKSACLTLVDVSGPWRLWHVTHER